MRSLTLVLSILQGTLWAVWNATHRLDQDRTKFQHLCTTLHLSNNSPKIRGFGIDFLDVRANEETAYVDGDMLEISVG